MRKYFLLGVAALMTATSVNATTDATGTFKASAQLIVPTTVSCSSIDFGKLYFKKGTKSTISTYSMAVDGKITNNSGKYELLSEAVGTPGTCSGTIASAQISGIIYLNSDETITVSGMKITDGVLTGVLTIYPEAELDGSELNGTTTVIFTYQ